MMRRYNVPVYANSMTWSAIMTNDLGKLNDDKIKIFEGVEPFSIGDIGIKPFPIPHDAHTRLVIVLITEGAGRRWLPIWGF